MNVSEHKSKKTRLIRRRLSGRRKLFGTPERPRLVVSRSNRGISAQLVDDISGRTLCSASSKGKSLVGQLKSGGNCAAAALVGQYLGEQARMHGIRKAALDRRGRRYHGRIKALADAARKTGLEF